MMLPGVQGLQRYNTCLESVGCLLRDALTSATYINFHSKLILSCIQTPFRRSILEAECSKSVGPD